MTNHTAKLKIAVVDLETTGPHFDQGDQIIQIGACIIEDGQLKHEYSMLLNPERSIPLTIQKLTGIEQEQADQAPKWESVASLWYERLKDCLFVAHNLKFDLTFMQAAFAKAGYEFKPQALDTVILAKVLVGHASGFNLLELSKYYGIAFEDAHDAIEDARVTAVILNQLAGEVLKLSNQKLRDLAPLVRLLPGETEHFFQAAECYRWDCQIYLEHEEPIKRRTPSPLAASTGVLADRLIETFHKWPRLWIEPSDFPLSPQVIEAVIGQMMQDGRNVLLVVPHNYQLLQWQHLIREAASVFAEEGLIIRKPSNYLHLQAFNQLLALNFTKLNQTEQISLASTIVWLTHTQTGDFTELNADIQIKFMFDKYCHARDFNGPHTFYERALDRVQSQKIVLMNQWDYGAFGQKEERALLYAQDRVVMLYDMAEMFDTMTQQQSVLLPLSQFFTQIRRYLDQYYNDLAFQQQLPNLGRRLNRLLDSLNQLLETAGLYLQETYSKESAYRGYHERYLSLEADLHADFASMLSRLFEEIDGLGRIHQIQEFLPDLLDDLHLWQKLAKQIQALPSKNFWKVSGEHMNAQFYRVSLHCNPLIFKDTQLNTLREPHSILCISLGDSYLLRQRGVDALIQKDELHFIRLHQSAPHQPLDIQVPLSYIGEAFQTPVDDANAMAQFINDEREQLQEQIVIICNNLTSIETIYQALLRHETLLVNDTILAQGVSGSLNKVRRRSMEGKRQILILHRTSFKNSWWPYRQQATSVLLQKLPFKSPDEPLVQAMQKLSSGERTFEVFDDILLPNMMQNFKELLNQLLYSFQAEDFFLFDERVYTKAYATRFRKDMQAWASFRTDQAFDYTNIQGDR